MSAAGLPLPVPDGDTEAFWAATARRELVVQRCGACGRYVWQPRPVCPRCQADTLVWTPVDGRGTVASWTVIHPPVLPALADLVPFAVLLVQLAIGVRMVGALVDGSGAVLRVGAGGAAGIDGLRIGAPVALRWRQGPGRPDGPGTAAGAGAEGQETRGGQGTGGFTLPAWTLEPEPPPGP